MKKSVFFKIFSGYLFTICLLSIGIFYFSFNIIREHHIQTLTKDMTKLGMALKAPITPLLKKGNPEELNTFVKRFGEQIAARITAIDIQGKVLADSEQNPENMENHSNRTEVTQAFLGTTSSSLRYSTTLKESMLYVAVPVKQGGKVISVLRVSMFLQEVNHLLDDLRQRIITITLVIICIAVIGSFFISRKLTTPIRILGDASGKIAAGDFSVKVLLNNNDELKDFADSFNFMTEKIRNLFEETTRYEEELKNIISSMQQGLMVINNVGKILLTNKSMKEIIHTDTCEGQPYWEYIREPEFGEMIRRVRQEEIRCVEELKLAHKTYLCNVSFGKQKQETIVIFLDISELKHVEQIKKDFVVNVSHELRTPLTAIKGFIETMEEEVENVTNKHYLDIIKRHTERLINIVKDLLLLSDLEQERHVEIEEVNLQVIINQAHKIHEQTLEEKGLTLQTKIDPGAASFKADPFALEQMFINLIDNAVKYTEEGGIIISCRPEADHIIISIEDTGIGIPQKYLQRIFERFYVVDKSRSRKAGGTGLGLSIVKHIVLLHNGTINVSSTPSKGTTFTISLPVNS